MNNNISNQEFTFNINKFLDAIINLARILHIENQLMEQFKFDQLITMQVDKEMIINYLDNSKQKIMKDPSIIKNANKKLLEKIKNANSNLTKILAIHEALIEKLIYTNRKIVEIFVTEFRKVNSIASGYDNKGIFKNSSKEYLLPPVTLKNLI